MQDNNIVPENIMLQKSLIAAYRTEILKTKSMVEGYQKLLEELTGRYLELVNKMGGFNNDIQ